VSITATRDGQFLFTSDLYGSVKQWAIASGSLVHHFEKIHDAGIRSICCTSDSQFLFTSDQAGLVKQWHIYDSKLLRSNFSL
jgi:WD40 repeat protein